MTANQDAISLVMAGHVDHGKSTVIGRLLAEIGALPQGKLDQVRAMCRRNARPFEYAFLLDALKDEQSQGITIDAARCFFKTDKRRYILIDAPGHIEFLKNMITGASRAEAALLVIDAREGIRENSKRHGYMMSMLGLRQLVVLVNKMDLVDYSRDVFEKIASEYRAFLERLGLSSVNFIPVSGMSGANIAARSDLTSWYDGPSVREQIDDFEPKAFSEDLPFRLPVQDVYKFTEQGDDRRIVAGTVETGAIAVGDAVSFMPSGKTARVSSIEYFNAPPRHQATAGEALGFTIEPQIYVKPGEWMTKAGDPPMRTATRFRVNLFWMGHTPMISGKVYKLKLGAMRSPVKLVEVLSVLDASELTTEANKKQVDRHDVAEVVLETPRPTAFDTAGNIEQTGRLVIVDDYEIAGAGIVLSSISARESTLDVHIRARETAWKPSAIANEERTVRYGHGAKFIVILDDSPDSGEALARSLERKLFSMNHKAYYLGVENVESGLDADLQKTVDLRDEQIRRLGELARIMTASGQIFITSIAGADEYDIRALALLNRPYELLTVVSGAGCLENFEPDIRLKERISIEEGIAAICSWLSRENIIVDYQI